MTKKQESKKVLELLGMPTEQQSDICCYSLLALLNLSPSAVWSAASNEWTRIHDILAFLRKNYRGARYAENSRETFRKQAMHHFRTAAIKRFHDDGDFGSLTDYLPSDLAKLPREQLRVCEATVQLDFKLLAMDKCSVNHAYYALPYNPYGTREKYAWAFPRRRFDMRKDESVKMGVEFWDLTGGEGTYKTFISVVNSLGCGYRERIYREFLCIEPPSSVSVDLLK